jgi:hypothetical protein
MEVDCRRGEDGEVEKAANHRVTEDTETAQRRQERVRGERRALFFLPFFVLSVLPLCPL